MHLSNIGKKKSHFIHVSEMSQTKPPKENLLRSAKKNLLFIRVLEKKTSKRKTKIAKQNGKITEIPKTDYQKLPSKMAKQLDPYSRRLG